MGVKNLVLSLVATSLLITPAMAKVNYKGLGKAHINVGVSSMEIDSQTTQATEIEVGTDFFYGERYTVGFNYVFELPDDSNITQFSAIEFNYEYKIANKTDIYGFVGYDFNDDATASGIGYGLGMKYQITDYLGTYAKFKYTSITPIEGDDYDKTVATFGIILNFKDANGVAKWQE